MAIHYLRAFFLLSGSITSIIFVVSLPFTFGNSIRHSAVLLIKINRLLRVVHKYKRVRSIANPFSFLISFYSCLLK